MRKTQKEIMSSWKDCSLIMVSVCCVTYNHASFIKQAIDSLLMQETDFAFEILIFDDASFDGTTDIIIKYAEKYPQIVKLFIQAENQYSLGGLLYPRFLFPKAKGKYIALCEGDDFWTDVNKLQKQVNFLEANNEYVITYTDIYAFNENGVIDKNFGAAKKDLSMVELTKSVPLFTLTSCFRNVIKSIPQDLLSVRYGDRAIWSLLGAYGCGKYLADIKPAAYRVHDEGVHSKVSRKKSAEMRFITFTALFSYHKRIGNYEVSSYFKKKALIAMLRSYIGI